MSRIFRLAVLGCWVLLLCGISLAHAEWDVTTQAGTQDEVVVASDSDGYFYVAWTDKSDPGNYDIYAQKFDASGIPIWSPSSGILVCSNSSHQELPHIAADGNGGAIIVWEDKRNGWSDIYAQRFSPSGIALWADQQEGFEVCIADNPQHSSKVIVKNGFIYMAWIDERNQRKELFAQRLLLDGGYKQWLNGIPVVTDISNSLIYNDFSMAIDDGGYLLIVFRAWYQADYDHIYAQRFNLNGVRQWEEDEGDGEIGPCVWCQESGEKESPQVAIYEKYPDKYYAVFACKNNGALGERILYTAHDEEGARAWVPHADELPLPTRLWKQYHLLNNASIATAGNGHIIIVWEDNCDGKVDIYAQLVSWGEGECCWGNGIAVCEEIKAQQNPQVVSGGIERSIIVWEDYRSNNWDIYAQALKHSTGGDPEPLLGEGGMAICDDLSNQTLPRVAGDGAGGAFFAWTDIRNSNEDIYASHIDAPPRECTVLSPNGGELWGIGSEQSITVQVEGFGVSTSATPYITEYELLVSYDGGVEYLSKTINSISENGVITELLWTVEGPSSSDCYVKIVTHYNDGPIGEDTSDLPLTIMEIDPDEIIISSTTLHEQNPHAVADGSGNFIVTWERDEARNYIYANKYDAFGNNIWPSEVLVSELSFVETMNHRTSADDGGGVLIVWTASLFPEPSLKVKRLNGDGLEVWSVATAATGDPRGAVVVADGDGGAIVAFVNDYSGDQCLFVNRIDNSGTLLWGNDGINVCDVNCDDPEISIIPDGSGGAHIAYQEGQRRPDYFTIYYRKVGADGTVSDAVGVSEDPYRQKHPQLIADGNGGVLVVWQDYRDNNVTDIYAQQIDTDLQRAWSANGEEVCTATSNQYWPKLTAAGGGGCIVTWHDNRDVDSDIYAQRFDHDGLPLWQNDGVLVCDAPEYQAYPEITSSRYGGYIISWIDNREGDDPENPIEDCALFAQQLDADGNPMWQANGEKIGGKLAYRGSDNFKVFDASTNGSCGAFAIWEDDRKGNDDDWDVFAKLIGEQQSCLATAWGAEGVEISGLVNIQEHAKVIPDGQGNTIIVWEDSLAGIDSDIFIQKIDASGIKLWPTDGVPVGALPNVSQTEVQLCTDGSGGTIVVWQDDRYGYYDIFAQRIDSNGSNTWTTNGIPVCIANNRQIHPQVVPDGMGGAIITWIDRRNYLSTGSDIYGQRVDATGQVLWTVDGLAVSTFEHDQDELYMIMDGSGGAYVTFHDSEFGYENIHALQIDGSGSVLWEHPICTAQNYQRHPKLLGDGAGGVIIVWQDYRNDWITDIYAQRVDATGDIVWTEDGIGVCISDAYKYWPTVADAGDGKAIIVWADKRSGDYDIYSQCIDLISGALQWSASAMPVATAPGDQGYCRVESIDDGDVVIGWNDERNGDSDIYAQKLTVNGTCVWSVDGIPISAIAGTDELELEMCNDGVGGFVFVWTDGRGAYPPDVFAQRLLENPNAEGDQQLDKDGKTIILATPRYRNGLNGNYPNPFNPSTTIKFSIEKNSHVNLSIYNVKGQLVRTLVNESKRANEYSVTWDGKDNRGMPVTSGVYFSAIRTDSFMEAKKLILLR